MCIQENKCNYHWDIKVQTVIKYCQRSQIATTLLKICFFPYLLLFLLIFYFLYSLPCPLSIPKSSCIYHSPLHRELISAEGPSSYCAWPSLYLLAMAISLWGAGMYMQCLIARCPSYGEARRGPTDWGKSAAVALPPRRQATMHCGLCSTPVWWRSAHALWPSHVSDQLVSSDARWAACLKAHTSYRPFVRNPRVTMSVYCLIHSKNYGSLECFFAVKSSAMFICTGRSSLYIFFLAYI